jgi:hypothetical protein
MRNREVHAARNPTLQMARIVSPRRFAVNRKNRIPTPQIIRAAKSWGKHPEGDYPESELRQTVKTPEKKSPRHPLSKTPGILLGNLEHKESQA